MRSIARQLARRNPNRFLIMSQFRGVLSAAVQKRVDIMLAQHKEIMEKLKDGDAAGSLGKDLSNVTPVAKLNDKLDSLRSEEDSMRELLNDAQTSGDKELVSECEEEVQRIEGARDLIEKQLIDAVLPKDEDDKEGAVLEIRAGTGGDEAALFASELLEAYTKTAKTLGWQAEVLSETRTDLGGVKEASIAITGKAGGSLGYDDSGHDDENSKPLASLGPYGFFRFESGVHRVQRVPVNDVRIHTSACSVAVLPSPADDRTDQLLPMSELKIETMRASGAGGQHVNTTESAVRITHIPTGITASIQDERSQHKNKAKALRLIAARVLEQKKEEKTRELGDVRSSLMGGGDRSERIRTYNYPQDRITDHRCKESQHGIARLLSGSAEDGLVPTFAPILRALAREELLQQLESER